MTPEQYQRVVELFHAASDLPPGERAEFLRSESGDEPGLIGEVEKMLAGGDRDTGFLRSAPWLPKSEPERIPGPGDTVLHYHLLDRLGEGGMGVVFKAWDSQLDRLVALKFLPLRISTHRRVRERFLQEAKTASALDHPNICTVHTIEETAEGQTFIVMTFYDGETLRARLRHEVVKPAPAITIARQAASGLAKAHSVGIVHCDIKPENMMLTSDGLVKILDFGIARLSFIDEGEEESVAGTLSYMSPEQLRGDVVDRRTDIWSLGLVLYEMLTGRNPFSRRGPTAAVDAILNQELSPPALTAANGRLIDRVLRRALAPHVSGRYQSMGEFLAALDAIPVSARAALAGAVPQSRKTAFLPVTETTDSEASRLCLKGRYHLDRWTEAGLATAIGYFEQALARDGNYARAWAGLAHAHLIQGLWGLRPSGQAWRKAREAAQAACRTGENLAIVQAVLAAVHVLKDWNWEAAERGFERAIEIDESDPAVHNLYAAYYLTPLGRLDEAVIQLRRCTELDPLSPSHWSSLALANLLADRYGEAQRNAQEAIELSPSFTQPYLVLIASHIAKGGPEEAVRILHELPEERRNHPLALIFFVRAYAAWGRRSEANEYLARLERPSDGALVSPVHLAGARIAMGRIESALDALESAYEARDSLLLYLKVAKAYAPLRGHPKYENLLQRLKLNR